MSNVIDINSRLARRQRNADIAEMAASVRKIIENTMVNTSWPRLFAGVTKMPIMVDWPDLEWATFGLDVVTVEKSPDNPLFGMDIKISTRYRHQYVPEFGNQSIVDFLTVRCVMREGVIKGIDTHFDTKQALLQRLLSYVNSFSQFPNTKFAFQMGFLSNLLSENTIHCPNVSDVDGKWVLKVLVPSSKPEDGMYMEVTMTFDFLPVVLDHMATEYVMQLPEDQV